MKKTLAKSLRSALALVLALCLTLGVAGTSFAAELPKVSGEELQTAVEGLVEVLKQNGPDVVKEAGKYALDHGYVEKVKESAAELKAMLKGYADEYGVQKAHAEKALEVLKAELKELKADAKVLADMIAAEKEALKDVVADNIAEPKAIIEEMEAALETLKAKIAKSEDLIGDAEAALKALDVEIESIREVVLTLEDVVKETIVILKDEAKLTAQAAVEKYTEVRDAAFALLGKLDKAAYTYIDELAADAIEATAAVVAEIKELVLFAEADLKATFSKYTKEEIIDKATELTLKLGNKMGVSNETMSEVAEFVKENAPAAIEKAKEILKKLKAAAVKAYREATTDDYCVDYDSYYVAIGDAVAGADESYVDLLAEELGVKVNKSMTGFNVLQDVKLNAAEIAKADLITLGFNATGMMGSAADAVMGADVAWGDYLPEDGVKAVDKAMAEVRKYVDAMGFGDMTAKAICNTIESVAFNSMVYTWKLPATIAEIRDINPNAVLVVVGLDNPLDNVTVTHNAVSLNIDKVMETVLATSDLYSLCYALLSGNCIFVRIPNAANDIEGETVAVKEFASVILSDFESLIPNADGQEDIKDYIYNALRITHGYKWGDANLDGVVDYIDAMIVLQYHCKLPIGGGKIFLPVCNVDGRLDSDGDPVDYVDAMLILQKHCKLRELFPVQE